MVDDNNDDGFCFEARETIYTRVHNDNTYLTITIPRLVENLKNKISINICYAPSRPKWRWK